MLAGISPLYVCRCLLKGGNLLKEVAGETPIAPRS